MSSTLVSCAFVVAVAAALRSTWSPCGWSMLSSITPLGERSKAHRFGVTAAWFVAGAAIGGAVLGGLAALGAMLVRFFAAGLTARLILGAVLTLLVAALDSARVGPALPHIRRQVNERWLDEFRPAIYALGFGAQIGAGLATYVMTGAVYLTLMLAALTTTPSAALAVGIAFGTVRGLAVFAGRHNDSPEKLLRFHRTFEAWGEPVRRIVVAVECAVAAALAASFTHEPAVTAAVALVVAVVSLRAQRPPRRPQRSPIAIPESTPLARPTSDERRENEPTTV